MPYILTPNPKDDPDRRKIRYWVKDENCLSKICFEGCSVIPKRHPLFASVQESRRYINICKTFYDNKYQCPREEKYARMYPQLRARREENGFVFDWL